MNSIESNSSVRPSALSTLQQPVLPVPPGAINHTAFASSQTSGLQSDLSSSRSAPWTLSSRSFPGRRAILAAGLSLALLGLASTVRAQLTISDDFNSGGPDTAHGWTAYEGSVNSDDGSHTREVQYLPDPGGSGLVYRLINHAPHNEAGIFTRGASIRNDATYVNQFFVAS